MPFPASPLDNIRTDSEIPAIGEQTRALFQALHGRLNDNITREVVLASAGLKVSRTCLKDPDLAFFLPIAHTHGLAVALSEKKYVHRPDVGKGGWSNSLQAEVPASTPDGLFNVYVASSERLVADGISFEETSDEEAFGSMLSIPVCCRETYLRRHPVAQRKQNDFVPLVLDDTTGERPYLFWNNYVAQYFGRALLSFFPCSFNCQRAADFARLTYRILRQCSVDWADTFVESQQTNILYTEYQGLHDLRNSTWRDGWIDYDPDQVQSTAGGEIARRLAMGDRLLVVGKHHVKIYHGERCVCEIDDEDISMCVFN